MVAGGRARLWLGVRLSRNGSKKRTHPNGVPLVEDPRTRQPPPLATINVMPAHQRTQAEIDEEFMREGLRLAHGAELAGEVPVGAVVVDARGAIVGRGYNRTLLDVDPSAHAEIIALREAAWKIGNHRLLECTVYATIEPCAMCAGALIQARIARLVYGADDPRAGAIRSVLQLAEHPALNHHFAVSDGVLTTECGGLLRQFFRGKRGKAAQSSDGIQPDLV